MNYMEKMEKRQSTREFRKKELNDDQKEQIRKAFLKTKRLDPDIDVEMLIADGDAGVRLEGLAGYGGNSFMAPDYIVILSDQDPNYMVNAGYLTEDLILSLTELGIDGCWITVNDSDYVKTALRINSPKEVVALVAVGFGKQERGLKRLDIFNPSNVHYRKREGHVAPKIAQDDIAYYGVWGNKVDWSENRIAPQIDHAIYAATLAPSFLNRQPYRYIFSNKILILLARKEEMVTENDTYLDIGATMLNFAAVMEEENGPRGPWKMGVPDTIGDTKKPDEYEIYAYYDLEH
ncbi:MAG: nitroreductase family protein [Eubacteriales bacterium]|jgi:hypothetical protein